MAVPPPPPPLSARLRQLCDDLIDHLVPGPAMTMAEQIRAKLAAPLTITVAGGVSSGKSTLVNALLGQRIAAVDAGECTRVVSEFRYGTHERVEVVAVDGAVTTLPLNRGRMPDHLGMPVERVRHVVVHLSNALLNHISVVDTPGLNTVTEVNEEATANFLGVSGREGEQTADAVSKADALVFLLPLLRQADAQVLRGFA
ncbi:MAG: dynamin family protein, partial [Ilumatobacter sp.]|nr:dynamin family protein [Ilumatobacter sp.]